MFPVIKLNKNNIFNVTLTEEAIQGQKTVMVIVVGNVKLAKKPGKTFCQNFIITAQGDKWKIVSDCLRFQETIKC